MIKTNFRPEIIFFAKNKLNEVRPSRFIYNVGNHKAAWLELINIATNSKGNPHDLIISELLNSYQNHKKIKDPSERSKNKDKIDVFHQFMIEFKPSFPDPGLNLLIEQIAGDSCLPEIKGFTGENPKLVINFCMEHLEGEFKILSEEEHSTSYCEDPDMRSRERSTNDSKRNSLNLIQKKIKATQLAYVKAFHKIERVISNESTHSDGMSPRG